MATNIEPPLGFDPARYRDPVPPDPAVPVDRSIKDNTADQILTIGYNFDASPEAVYDAWTIPDELAQWFGPKGFHTEDVVFDAKPGGQWSLVMIDDSGERYPAHGTILEVQRPSRIVMTDCWDVLGIDAPDSTITIDISEAGVQTALMMHEAPMPSRQELIDSQAGWLESFVKLGRFLAGGQG